MIGEINSEVQQRVDSFRDNPQGLMQQYQQSQQLIDLLALQKLKSEKEAVARNMQMQMQTMPQTIKQQREAELLGMTKNELVGQMQGTLAQQARQAQQAPQRPQPQTGGIPQLPAGNMQRMAGGGIVSYAEGGAVEDIIDTYIRKGADAKSLREIFGDDPKALRYLEQKLLEGNVPSGQVDMGNRPAEGMSVPSRAPEIDVTNIASLLGPKETKSQLQEIDTSAIPKRKGISGASDRFGGVGLFGGEKAPATTTPSKPKEGGGISDFFRQIAESASKTPGGIVSEQVRTNRELSGEGGLGGLYQEPSKPRTMSPEALQQMSEAWQGLEALDNLKEIDLSTIPERKKTIDEMEAAGIASVAAPKQKTPRELLMEEITRQNDPDKIRRDELRKFLIGASRGSNLASAMAGGSSALANARERRDANRIANLEKLAKMDADEAAAKIEQDNSKALQDIRAMQADTQRFSAIAAQYDTVKAQLETVLLQDDAYKDAVAELESEKNAWFPNTDDIAKAEAKVAQAMENAINKVPSFRETKKMYEELLAKMSGGSAPSSANVPTSGFTVKQKS